jgi:hypothetical protein
MQIIKIDWLSQEALEAEVTISDDTYNLICFSQPFQYKVGTKLTEPLYCLNVSQTVKSHDKKPGIERLDDHFSYRLSGKLYDKENLLILVGELCLELDIETLPGDILENDFLTFECSRIDIF